MIKKKSKSMILCVRGTWSRARRGLEMQRFGHILRIFVDWKCAWLLGGCGLGDYWSLEATGPCQTYRKTFKIVKSKYRALVPSQKKLPPPKFSVKLSKNQIGLMCLVFNSKANPLGF